MLFRIILLCSCALVSCFLQTKILNYINSKNSLKSTLTCGDYTIDASYDDLEVINQDDHIIRLVDIGSGWGDGQHPTTKMCLEFVNECVKKGDVFLDYGCGSGILSILGAKKGAKKCIAVDIDEDCLRAASKNIAVNGFQDRIEVLHTARVCPGDLCFEPADVTVANILPGALTRLIAALWMSTKPGGIRPEQFPAIKRLYSPFVDLDTERLETASHPQWGAWIRWSVKTKMMGAEEFKAAKLILQEKSFEL